jgi:uncharacterized UBP type Zn finger protein
VSWEEEEPTCEHVIGPVSVTPSDAGCHECLQIGGEWVHLRMCLACGHVGCCDQSPNRHATAHFRETSHPAVQSVEQDEDWRWCYADEIYGDGPSGPA